MQIYRSHDPLLDLETLGLEAELETEPAVRALVVANDPLVRSGFVRRLAGAAAGEAQLDDDLGEAIAVHGANLVLWDVGPMPAGADFEVDDAPVPVVALCPEGSDARNLLRRGASGVLLRDGSSGATLRNALRTVLCGLTVVDPRFVEASLADETASRDDDLASPPIESLTGREQEVLELMATGLSNKQIGDRLGISAHTAKFHIGAILGKLDAQSRTEAVVRAVQHRLVTV